MRTKSLALVLFAILPLAACEPDETGEMVESIETEAVDVNAGQSLAVDTLDVAARNGSGMQAAVALNELGGSGIGGEATIAPAEASGQTQVTVSLQGPADAAGVHQGHIHSGTCEQLGGVVVPLPPVTVDDGVGSATSTVAADAMSLMDGQHIVVYHQAGGTPGSPVVCGQIPAHAM